jgi:hypothetical protein
MEKKLAIEDGTPKTSGKFTTCMVEIMKMQGLQSHSLIRNGEKQPNHAAYSSSPSRTGSPADNPSPRGSIQVVDHPPPSRYSSTFFLDFSDSMLSESVPKSTTKKVAPWVENLDSWIAHFTDQKFRERTKKKIRTFQYMARARFDRACPQLSFTAWSVHVDHRPPSQCLVAANINI